MINPDNQSRTVGTVSLVLGLLSIVPFGALAGVPAVVLAVYALREEPRSRGRAGPRREFPVPGQETLPSASGRLGVGFQFAVSDPYHLLPISSLLAKSRGSL